MPIFCFRSVRDRENCTAPSKIPVCFPKLNGPYAYDTCRICSYEVAAPGSPPPARSSSATLVPTSRINRRAGAKLLILRGLLDLWSRQELPGTPKKSAYRRLMLEELSGLIFQLGVTSSRFLTALT